MIWRACLLFLSLFCAGPTAEARALRVMSLNLCADQLLMALADRADIVSLSPFARDVRLSFLAETAVNFPLNRGTGEEVLVAKPDLVLIGRFGRPATRELLRRFNVATETLEPWRGLEDGVAQIRRIAERLGRVERGEALISRIREAEQDARAVAGAKFSAVMLQRRGWVGGPDSFTGALIEHAGLINAAPNLGLSRSRFVPLEQIVMRPPDLLVLSSIDPQAIDQGTALLGHPVLNDMFDVSRRIAIPERLVVCGGPSTPDALRHIAAEVRRVAP
jgi:iron complex transport system substrate-binding protein